MALFRLDARIGAGRVHQGEDGQLELGRQLHGSQRLAVALGIRAAEVALQVALGVAALLGADDDDRLALQARHAADDGAVIAVDAIAMQFDEVGAHLVDVVHRVGAQRVARHLHALPGR